jgi:PmbA protein
LAFTSSSGPKTEKKSILLESEDTDRSFTLYNDEGFFLKEKEISQEILQEKFKALSGAEDFSQDPIKTILLSPQVLTRLIRYIIPVFDLKEKYFTSLAKGEKIFSECINLVASGSSPLSEMQKYAFDLEGVPIKKNVLVSKGILQNYFFDTYLASKENAMSSGNRVRHVGDLKPSLGAFYNYIEPNPHQNEKEIFSDVESGLIIEFLDKIQLEPNQDILKAKVLILGHGYEVNKSKKIPRRNIFIQCSIFDLLNNAVQLTNNIKFYSRIGSPWALVKLKTQK